jgi:hypothetical protein
MKSGNIDIHGVEWYARSSLSLLYQVHLENAASVHHTVCLMMLIFSRFCFILYCDQPTTQDAQDSGVRILKHLKPEFHILKPRVSALIDVRQMGQPRSNH